MRTTIRDIDILKSINPLEVAGYLKTQGWQQQSQINDIASIDTKIFLEKKFKLIIVR